MNSIHTVRNSIVCLVFAGFLFNAFGRDIAVTGTVVDAADKPVEQAIVLLSGGIGVNDSLVDTAFTGRDGTFSKKITIRDYTRTLFYAVQKDGYATSTGQKMIPGGNDRVDLGKIVLRKSGPTKKITVVGTVLDARTQSPIEKALVILSEVGIGITDPPESTFTDRGGNFAQVMEIDSGGIGSVRPTIGYRVIKDGYAPANGTERIQRDTVKIGRILLRPLSVPITNHLKAPVQFYNANRMVIYSLKGQLLYSGKPLEIQTNFYTAIGGFQPIVVHYLQGDILVNIRKITQVR